MGVTLALMVLAGCGSIDLPPANNDALEPDPDPVSCAADAECDASESCMIASCVEGVCKETLKDNACWIEEQCYLAGQDKPGDLCRTCDPALSQDGFIKTQCDEGFSCEPTTGECAKDEVPLPDVVDSDVEEGDGQAQGDVSTVDGGAGPESDADASGPEDANSDGEGADATADSVDDANVEPGPSVLYGAELTLSFGEESLSVHFDEADEPMVHPIYGDSDWQSNGHLILGIEEQYFVLSFTAPAEGWELPPTKPSIEGEFMTMFICPHGFSDTLEGAQAAVGTADATEPHKTGCTSESGVSAWLLVASLPELLSYWGAESCCAPHGDPGCGGADVVCAESVCVDLPECCQESWGEGCSDAAFAQCEICDFCGDGYCDTAFGENCGSCSEDCGVCVCNEEEGELLSCEGVCVTSEGLSNEVCEAIYNCEALGWDGGDCCPPGEVAGCAPGSCYDASLKGNGLCDGALNCAETEWDAGDCCPPGTEKGCDAVCYQNTLLGNGVCDPGFDCPGFNFDEGDCCAPGQVKGCDGLCKTGAAFGNGTCDPLFNCPESGFDGGDCCTDIQTLNCAQDACVPQAALGNGQCEPDLECEALNWDGGDCPVGCPDGTTANCGATDCLPATALGNGICDAAFQCAALDWDSGDCPLVCGPGFVLDCSGSQCLDEGWLADLVCDPSLLCETHAFDGGDCCAGNAYNQICEPNLPTNNGAPSQESIETCPLDCGPCPNSDNLKTWLISEAGCECPVGGNDSYPLVDVVMGPTGAHYATWATANQLFISDFAGSEPVPDASLQGELVTQVLEGPVVGAPSIARHANGALAVVYHSAGQGLFLKRSTAQNPMAFGPAQPLLAQLPNGQSLAGRPEVSFAAAGGDLFISILLQTSEGGEQLASLIRVNGQGAVVSDAAEPLGGAGVSASSKHDPTLVTLDDGRATLVWGAANGAAIQWVAFDGAKGPVNLVPVSEFVTSVTGRPAVASAGSNTILVAWKSVEPMGFWLFKYDVVAQEMVAEAFREVPAAFQEYYDPATEFQPRSFDLAVNGDGWGLLAYSTEDTAYLAHLPPSFEGDAPDDIPLDGFLMLPAVAAADCFDDAVVMMTPGTPTEPLRRIRFLADADTDGKADLCCVAE